MSANYPRSGTINVVYLSLNKCIKLSKICHSLFQGIGFA